MVYSGLSCFTPGYSLVGGYTLGCYTGPEEHLLHGCCLLNVYDPEIGVTVRSFVHLTTRLYCGMFSMYHVVSVNVVV